MLWIETYRSLLPERTVTKDEVSTAKNTEAGLTLKLETVERDIQRAHGALEQVGGAVARNGCGTRLRRLSWRKCRARR